MVPLTNALICNTITKGKKMKNVLKKGDLIRFNYYSMSHSIYMIIGELENNKFYLIRVKRKDKRFDIKRKIIMTLDIKSNYCSLVNLEELNLDKRDLYIFNDFHQYILNNTFKFKFETYSYQYLIGKKRHTYTQTINLVIYNLNLSKYKKYSNKV